MTSKNSWFQFRRRTLWMIIAILIPAIVVLNRTGSEDQGEAQTLIDAFEVSQLRFVQEDQDWWVALPNSGKIAIAVASKRQPVSRINLPEHSSFRTSVRNGYSVTYVSTMAEKTALDLTLDFLNYWLPEDDDDKIVVLAGEVTENTLSYVRKYLSVSVGDSVAVSPKEPDGLTVVPLPSMGQANQMAYIMAAGILQKRMSGYAPRLSWNHQGMTSYLSINATLAKEWLTPISEAEFQRAKNEMLKLAGRSQRSFQQLHNYLTTVALYGLDQNFILNQAGYIEQTTLQDVQVAFSAFQDTNQNL